MIDRYLLRYFIAVVEHGNFSRAARACNVSQPTLSVGIAKLERELGQPLFLRSNQRVELTASGARFLGHAQRIERVCSTADVDAALLRMAARVDAQNGHDPGYRPLLPNSLALEAARALVFQGATQPNGYTEPLLHAFRQDAKSRDVPKAGSAFTRYASA